MVIEPGEGLLVRVFIGESDRHEGIPLYQWIVRKARSEGLAGATVIRGVEGYGATSRVHTTKILRLSEDLPMIVEIVDRKERVQPFLEWLDAVVVQGLVTVERVDVRFYR